MNRLLLFLLFYCSTSLGDVLLDDYFAQKSEGRIFFNSLYLKTTNNYDNTSTVQVLGSGKSLTYARGSLGLAYGISSRLFIYPNITLGYSRSLDGTFARDQLSLAGVKLGVGYRLIRNSVFAFTPVVNFYVPFRPFDESSDKVSIDDGLSKFQFGGRFAKGFGSLRLKSDLLIEIRNKNFSNLFPYSLILEWAPPGFLIGGGITGFLSLNDDPTLQSPASRIAFFDRANGSSFYFNSIRPRLLQGQLETRFAWGDLNFLLGGRIPLHGVRISKNIEFLFGLSWRISERKPFGTKDPIEGVPSHIVAPNDSFEPEDENEEEIRKMFDDVGDIEGSSKEEISNKLKSKKKRSR